VQNQNRQKVLNSFINRFKGLDDPDLKPHIIVITGDIAHNGNIDDYNAFHTSFLEKLLHVTGLGIEDVVLCPGNHDMVQDEFMKDEYRAERGIEIKSFHKKFFSPYLTYQANNNYIELENSKNIETEFDFTKYLYGHRKHKGIDFIVLNSSWNCRTKDWGNDKFKDFGKLTFGAECLADAFTFVESVEGAKNYVIVLSHHPFFFDTTLANEDIEPKLYQHPHERDDDKKGILRYVSSQFQWIRPEEIFINSGSYDGREYSDSAINYIQNTANLVLCGHTHIPKGPLPVGTKGTVGFISGAMNVYPHQQISARMFRIDMQNGTQEERRILYDDELWSIAESRSIQMTANSYDYIQNAYFMVATEMKKLKKWEQQMIDDPQKANLRDEARIVAKDSIRSKL
jgi:3',5'-cyclic AMP phosphodiesterase CpdA